MKSRTSGSKTSASNSKRKKGLSRTAKVLGATTVGAIAGGLVGTAIASRKRPNSAIGKTARKLKNWVKSAATSPSMKSLAKGLAEQAVTAQLGNRPSGRKGQSVSARSSMVKTTGKTKKKK